MKFMVETLTEKVMNSFNKVIDHIWNKWRKSHRLSWHREFQVNPAVFHLLAGFTLYLHRLKTDGTPTPRATLHIQNMNEVFPSGTRNCVKAAVHSVTTTFWLSQTRFNQTDWTQGDTIKQSGTYLPALSLTTRSKLTDVKGDPVDMTPQGTSVFWRWRAALDIKGRER